VGLRETKAERTRERVVSEAMALFAADGFDATTMERIAAAAEISPATLYRYFPSKDRILASPMEAIFTTFTDTFRDRPADEDLGVSLAAAIDAVLTRAEADPDGTRVMRRILDESPIPRARLWDDLAAVRARLAELIATRTGRSPGDIDVVLTARTAILLLETAADMWRFGNDDRPSRQIVVDLYAAFHDGRVTVPRPE